MIAALQVSPELEAEVLAALPFPARSSLYVTPACTPRNAGCLLVIDAEGRYPHGQVLGLAVPVPGGSWRLACTRCRGPVTWDETGRGRCAKCAADWNGAAA
jgi:hypothetical protein